MSSPLPPIVQFIRETLYGGLPPVDVLSGLVLPYVTAIKIIELAVVAKKYGSSSEQPFSLNVYRHSFLGAATKLCLFSAETFDLLPADGWAIKLLEDLTFVFVLIGIFVTTGLDFLWALSSSADSDVIFRRNISESDFVSDWTRYQRLVIVFLPCCRYILPSYEGLVVVHSSFNFWLYLSYGFIWYCLWKVRGAAQTQKFKDAYRKAFAVTSIVFTCIFTYTLFFVPLFYDMSDARLFIVVTHFLETTSTHAQVIYFAFLKAPPANLQKKKIVNWSQMRGVLDAKSAFKKASKKES